MDWFLYDVGLRHERVKLNPSKFLKFWLRIALAIDNLYQSHQ